MFDGCTYIDGNLDINWLRIPDVKFDFSFLKNILEVTGYVRFQGVYTDALNLTNLRIIRGETLTPDGAALQIQWNYQTGDNPGDIGLKQLGLVSLRGKYIARGSLMINTL